MLDNKTRYLQIAFNGDLGTAISILPKIPKDERIFIEAGTPFIKRYGFAGIRALANLWRGVVVADIKTVDGALGEVMLARSAGASAATVVGSSPKETIDLFIENCEAAGIYSMIDMIGVADPLRVLRGLKKAPDIVVLHRGRDEESNREKAIPYRQVNRIKSKFDVLISAAGGVDLKEARSAIFNGASIVVVNVVEGESFWKGISVKDDIANIARDFLRTIE